MRRRWRDIRRALRSLRVSRRRHWAGGSRLRALRRALDDRFTVHETIHRTPHSLIYRATDRPAHRYVAIKVLEPTMVSSADRRRFLRDVEATARLVHPHIAPVLASGEAAGLPYAVLPFYAEGSLRDRIARAGQPPIEEAVGFVRNLVDAVAYAHEREIVHLDLKPDNVLISGGRPVLADFGPGGPRPTTQAGTPGYRSPEQERGESGDTRTDVYGLGRLAYELLAGRGPVHSVTQEHALRTGRASYPLRLPDDPRLGETLRDVIHRALAIDPDARFRDAAALRHALSESAVGGGSLPAAVGSTVAVLPFTALSPHGPDHSLAAGIAEDTAAALAGTGAVAVLSRTSTRSGDDPSGVPTGASHLLTGRVRRSGTQLRVVTELIDAATSTAIWTESLTADMTDSLTTQRLVGARIAGEVAAAIAQASPPLTPLGV